MKFNTFLSIPSNRFLSNAVRVNMIEVEFDYNMTRVTQRRQETRLPVCQASRIDPRKAASYFPQPSGFIKLAIHFVNLGCRDNNFSLLATSVFSFCQTLILTRITEPSFEPISLVSSDLLFF